MRRAVLVLLLILSVAAGLGPRRITPAGAQEGTPAASPAANCPVTTPTRNVAIARRWTEEALNQGNLDVLDEILAPDVVYRAGVFPDLNGPEAVKGALGAILAGFPDIQFTVDQVIAEGDQVAVRWTGRGTHQGPFLGVEATGNPVTFTGINFYRFECGRIAEGWSEADGVGILQQLGVLPAPAATPPAGGAAVSPVATCPAASVDENRTVAHRWFADAVNPNNLDLLDEIVAGDAVLHAAAFPDAYGPEGIKGLFGALFAGFPDLQFAVADGPAEGDLVVERWTASGTQQGEFQGIAPTGKAMSWTGINIYRIACGRIAEVWTETDGLGRLQQLGALPSIGIPVATPTG